MRSAVKVTIDQKANRITKLETVSVPDDTQTGAAKAKGEIVAIIVTDDTDSIIALVNEVRRRHEAGLKENLKDFDPAWRILHPLDMDWAVYGQRYSVIDSIRIIAVANWWKSNAKDIAYRLVPDLGFRLSWGLKGTGTVTVS